MTDRYLPLTAPTLSIRAYSVQHLFDAHSKDLMQGGWALCALETKACFSINPTVLTEDIKRRVNKQQDTMSTRLARLRTRGEQLGLRVMVWPLESCFSSGIYSMYLIKIFSTDISMNTLCALCVDRRL